MGLGAGWRRGKGGRGVEDGTENVKKVKEREGLRRQSELSCLAHHDVMIVVTMVTGDLMCLSAERILCR